MAQAVYLYNPQTKGLGALDWVRIQTDGTLALNDGTNTVAVLSEDSSGNISITNNLTIGVDDDGGDVIFYGATSGKNLTWDESADKLIVTGDTDLSGTTTILAGGGIDSNVSNGLFPVYLRAAPQAISGAGALTITEYKTGVTTTGANALTLADGSIKGQMKLVQMIVDGGDGTLTPANLSGGTTITFADVGDCALLQWGGSDWLVLDLYNIVDGATAPVLA